MKNGFLRKYNKLISRLLAILGIGCACTTSCAMYGTGYAEYGTPTASFKVYGTVLSEDSTEIPYIRVVMQNDTMYSDPDGNYSISDNNFPGSHEFQIEFSDTDGAENESWQTLDTTVAFVDPKFKNGDGDWYAGETTKEFNVKLTKKE